MKQSVFKWMLMAVVVCGLSLSVTSCKDDDDTPSEEQQRQEQTKIDEKDAAWMVLSQLVDPMTAGDDWTKQTFEPVIGEADAENTLTRVVMTNTLANAAQRFANLVGLETMDSTTATYTYSNPQLGTLTYQRSSDGLSLATVTVDIKAVPKLQQIVYRRPNQTGENGLFNSFFDGRAYYRFGDVVRLRRTDQKDEYWVCVRPSLGYEGKGDSHWVTLSPVPDANVKEMRVKDRTFRIPTSLGTDKENTENFGELLSAVLDYDEGWHGHYKDIDANVFHDLDFYLHRRYASNYFWHIVNEGWEKNGIVSNLFGHGISNNAELLNVLKSDGIRLLYNGYSSSWVGNKCTLYQTTLKGPGANQPLTNLLKPEYSTETKDLSQCSEFNVQRLEQQDLDNFFIDGKQRWCIRHATGKQLGGGSYDKQKSIATFNPAVEDVYVYYRYAAERGNEIFDLKRDPETTTLTDRDHPQGFHTDVRGYFIFGDVVKDADANDWICVQGSRPEDGQNYSYFISFDKCVKKNGSTDFTQLPSLEVAKQIAFALLEYSYDYDPVRYGYFTHRLLISRVGFNYGALHSGRIINIDGHCAEDRLWSLLYRNPQDGKPYIMRLVQRVDTRNHVGENLDQEILNFFTCYEKDLTTNPRLMSVDDLSNQQVVSQYAQEEFCNWNWVLCNWDRSHDAETAAYSNYLDNALNEAYREAEEKYPSYQGWQRWYMSDPTGWRTEAIKKDDKQWQLDSDVMLQGNTKGTNMYKEPVLMVAVKRCVDNGSKPYHFADADNTPLYTYLMNTSDKESLYYRTKRPQNIYRDYNHIKSQGRFRINGQPTDNPFNPATPIQ